MDILNFISWIRGARKVNSVDPNQTLVPLGAKDNRRDDKYLTVTMTVADFANQIGANINTQQLVTDSIWANGFINTSCIAADITLPDNATFNYQGPLSICTGYTLTIPANTTLTVL
jgi:hypothetical protein